MTRKLRQSEVADIVNKVLCTLCFCLWASHQLTKKSR